MADPDDNWKTILEFRHSSWYNDGVIKFIKDHEMYVNVHDIPASVMRLNYILEIQFTHGFTSLSAITAAAIPTIFC